MQSSEIELGVVRVVDTQANEYGGSNRAPHRYIAEQQVTVRTSRVDQAAAAAQKTMQLLQKGIVLNSNPGQGLIYKFTGLNSIKPDMITEATRNARSAANRFASDSGSKVGAIRQANQGVFSILPADQGSDTSEPGDSGGGNFAADSSLMKLDSHEAAPRDRSSLSTTQFLPYDDEYIEERYHYIEKGTKSCFIVWRNVRDVPEYWSCPRK